ncbi:MAG TPA: S8 family serine peptidase, partial [Stellaceae bacterium]|nr:S8 family serine peptidase [Stellaceae bacterium]
PSSQATLALAINQCAAEGADIITISSGQQTATGQADRFLTDAVRNAAARGTLIVAAAGNDGCRCVQVPGALDSVLAVGACDLAGTPLPFSNFGDLYRENGILAPGENVKGASPLEGVALRSGTSFATPIVAGVAALLLSCVRQSGGTADPRAVRDALLATARACAADAPGDPRCLAGQLDIAAAMTALLGDLPAPNSGLTMPEASGAVAPYGHANYTVTKATSAREGIMADSADSMTVSAPRILGPDGFALRGAVGVTPNEAAAAPTAVPLPAPPAEAPAGPAANPAAGAAAAAGAPGMFWMPMSMPPGLAPGWTMPSFPGLLPNAAPPQFVPPPPAVIPAAVPAVQPAAERAVTPACCGGVRPSQALEPAGQMAFPIGQLYYDFGREARLDYFVQAIANWRDGLTGRGDPAWGVSRDRSADTAAPYSPEIMARYLLNIVPGEAATPAGQGNNFPDADAIIWTLTIDTIPIYAIKPLDVFGLGFYASLVLALWHQEVSHLDPGATTVTLAPRIEPAPAADAFPPQGGVTRVSLAGWVDSRQTTKLLNGTVVPTLVTDWRGFYTWDLYTLLGPDSATWPAGAAGFLERVYNEFRNVGLAPQDRALNYSAMNAYNTRRIFADSAKGQMRLDTVEIDRSVICRPESDCWDVTYRFFNPEAVLTQARQVYQYTIDVSDVVPVAVGPLRQWQVY